MHKIYINNLWLTFVYLFQWVIVVGAALIWQLMRAYTLSVLTQLANTGNPMVEKEIVTWVNNKLNNAGKTTSLRNFQVRIPHPGSHSVCVTPDAPPVCNCC